MKKNVLGVKIDDITSEEALERVKGWLEGKGKYYIVTPNPEFLVAAQKDQVFRKLLNDADLSIPDGVGLKLSGKVKNTVYGVDFMEKLVEMSNDYGFTVSKAPLRVGLLGGKGGGAKRAAECLRKKYPKVKIVFADSGGEIDDDGNVIARTLNLIQGTKQSNERLPRPFGARNDGGSLDILFVAFGHIKQEKWIGKNLKKIPVKVAMGVGGAFDYLSGEVMRAPKFIRVLGLEWLFRLILQPWRIKRQLALVKYMILLGSSRT